VSELGGQLVEMATVISWGCVVWFEPENTISFRCRNFWDEVCDCRGETLKNGKERPDSDSFPDDLFWRQVAAPAWKGRFATHHGRFTPSGLLFAAQS
jgi:hypothetical protein